MSPRAKRARAKRIACYTDEHRAFLRDFAIGWVHQIPEFVQPGVVNAAIGPQDADLDAMRDAWCELGGELTAEFIAENPGRRGYWWWVFDAPDAPEPRRRILRGPDVLYVDTKPDGADHWWYGVPSVFAGDDFKQPLVVESQAAYLDRHELLTIDERLALGEDFDREEVLCSGPEAS